MKQLKLILIGGGDRGSSYLKYLDTNPDKFKLVAIAEPIDAKRNFLGDKYGVSAEMRFESYEDLLEMDKIADIAMICTQDKMHFDPAMKAIAKKYDLLLEKPIAPTPEECYKIAESAKNNGVKVLVGHVLRYTPFYKAVKTFIAEGKLGDVINVVHTEGVGLTNMSHSFVRGNWRREDESAPMILAKCCHDTDLVQWLIGDVCTKVQSVGMRSYFCEDYMPEGAPKRCTDGCPHKDTCFFYAPKFYRIDTAEMQHFRAIVTNKFDPTFEEIDEILKTSPYGRCVFQCDNDVVDHQTVNMQFGENKLVTLTMSPFNKGGRITTIMGTKGEIRADMEDQSVEFYEFATMKSYNVFKPDVAIDQTIAGGHGGGDMGIMADLYDYVAEDKPSISVSDADISCLSHLICFAAEESRKNDTVVNMKDFVASL